MQATHWHVRDTEIWMGWWDKWWLPMRNVWTGDVGWVNCLLRKENIKIKKKNSWVQVYILPFLPAITKPPFRKIFLIYIFTNSVLIPSSKPLIIVPYLKEKKNLCWSCRQTMMYYYCFIYFLLGLRPVAGGNSPTRYWIWAHSSDRNTAVTTSNPFSFLYLWLLLRMNIFLHLYW